MSTPFFLMGSIISFERSFHSLFINVIAFKLIVTIKVTESGKLHSKLICRFGLDNKEVSKYHGNVLFWSIKKL